MQLFNSVSRSVFLLQWFRGMVVVVVEERGRDTQWLTGSGAQTSEWKGAIRDEPRVRSVPYEKHSKGAHTHTHWTKSTLKTQTNPNVASFHVNSHMFIKEFIKCNQPGLLYYYYFFFLHYSSSFYVPAWCSLVVKSSLSKITVWKNKKI